MSFQGDVRGIGLAELLQGLARGRKEGILTLSAKGGGRSVLGVESGSIFLLPDPDESPEIWRDRMRNAFADDPAFQIDGARMSAIASAARLDALYALLDGEGVHFRFEPEEIPGRGDRIGDEAVYCDGIPIDYLLLEYARINDELTGVDFDTLMPADALPHVVDPQVACAPGNRSFYEACDNISTLQETADRLGMSLRQAQLCFLGELRGQRMCFTSPGDVLQLAIHELRRDNVQRGAARIRTWIRTGPPGPMQLELADALAGEWQAGRLPAVLPLVPAADVRVFLRRLGHSLGSTAAALRLWEEAERAHPWDVITRLRRMARDFRAEDDGGRPELRELLELSRSFREAETPWRSGPLLVLAAHLQPESPQAQLELGQGLLQAGRVPEGAPWILSGAEALLDKDEADRAVVPLRALYEADRHNRECRQLLTRAKRSTTQVRKLRKNLIISLAGTAALAGMATVQVRREQIREEQLSTIDALAGSPRMAIAELDRLFPDDDSEEITQLRDDLRERERLDEVSQRNAWIKAYNDASSEANSDEPVLGLTMALELPPPPRLSLIDEPWPLRRDLYTGLVATLERRIEELGEPDFEDADQLASEAEIKRQVSQLTNVILEEEQPTLDLAELSRELASLGDRFEERDVVREEQALARMTQELQQEQDRLWQLAVGHSRDGNFQQAGKVYDQLLETDTTGQIASVLEPEIRTNTERMEAVSEAQRLSDEGRHPEAFALLVEKLKEDHDPRDYIMPWDVESFPSGAAVTVDGTEELSTPFRYQSTFGDSTQLLLELPGFLPRTVEVAQPEDQHVFLSRVPERSWQGSGRIDAMPVQLEDGSTIVADRKGSVARIASGGELIWKSQIQTLAGIARSPVFLPDMPGHLLMVTEDGFAWLIREQDGDLSGPRDLGSPPAVGPYQTQSVVRVRLEDDRIIYWKDRLKPYTPTAQTGGSLVDQDALYAAGSRGGLQVLVNVLSEQELACRWSDWKVTVEEEVYRIECKDRPEATYTVLRDGEWQYLAWENRSEDLREGRLWISDGAGLRAFVPLDAPAPTSYPEASGPPEGSDSLAGSGPPAGSGKE